MKKKIIIAVFVGCVALVGILIPWFTGQTPQQFINHWGSVFAQCNSLDALNSILDPDYPDHIYVRKFPNGEWVVAKSEHACSGGAGFDATVFLDSNGLITYQTTHHYCGYEGLCGDLRRAGGTNLTQFYAGLDNDVELKIWNIKDQQVQLTIPQKVGFSQDNEPILTNEKRENNDTH